LANLAWFKWSQHLNHTYNQGEAYFAISVDPAYVLFNIKSQHDLARVYRSLLPAYFKNWTVFPLFLFGIVLGFRQKWRALSIPMAAWGLTCLLFCTLLSQKLHVHWYYAAIGAFPFAYFLALGLLGAYEAMRNPAGSGTLPWCAAWALILTALAIVIFGSPSAEQLAGRRGLPWQGLGWLAQERLLMFLGLMIASVILAMITRLRSQKLSVLILLAAAYVGAMAMASAIDVLKLRSQYHDWPRERHNIESLRAAADRYSTRQDLFVTDFDNGSPAGLYRAHRKGWAEPLSALNERGFSYFADRGASFYVHSTRVPLPGGVFPEWLLERGSDWELYCLRATGCQPRR
jgi:hypothetical protein